MEPLEQGPIDIKRAFEEEPPPLDFVFYGLLAGSAGLIENKTAPGGHEVSRQLAFQLAYAVASEDTLNVAPTHTGDVVYLAAREPERALQQRINALNANLMRGSVMRVRQNLQVYDLSETGLDLMHEDHFQELVRGCTEKRLVVLDTLHCIPNLDRDHSGNRMRLLKRLEELAMKTGAGVLAVHDLNDEYDNDDNLVDHSQYPVELHGMSETEAEAFGTRGQASLQPEHFVRYSFQKIKYDEQYPDQWYTRNESGVLIPSPFER